MAAKKKARRAAKAPTAMIISKSRVKAAVKKCNVGAEFYGALEGEVRDLIKRAEERAIGNRRKTLRAADV
jgi:histone H3/H4